jgi:hypothetical protein
MQKIGQAQQEMMQLTGLRTQGAFKHLGYDSQQFQLMKGRTFSTPEQMKALQEYKATLPARFDSDDLGKQPSRAEVKAIWMQKVTLEGELLLKQLEMMAPN